jgi:hypothetical protein
MTFVKRAIAWSDAYRISAVQTSTRAYFWQFDTLTLRICIRPRSVAAYDNKRQLRLNINQWVLPMKEFVRLRRRYHTVTFLRYSTLNNRS